MAVLAIAPANAPAIRDDVTLSYEVKGFELDCSDRNLKIREKKNYSGTRKKSNTLVVIDFYFTRMASFIRFGLVLFVVLLRDSKQ